MVSDIYSISCEVSLVRIDQIYSLIYIDIILSDIIVTTENAYHI
jgi:hypothetical protein